MKSDRGSSIILHGYNLLELNRCKVVMNIKSKNITIIRGTIYTENNEPSIGVAIEVKKINCSNKKSLIIGYCFTDDKGEYVFPLEATYGMCYEISIYSPLI